MNFCNTLCPLRRQALGALFYLIAAAPSHIVAAKSQVTIVIVLAVVGLVVVCNVLLRVRVRGCDAHDACCSCCGRWRAVWRRPVARWP